MSSIRPKSVMCIIKKNAAIKQIASTKWSPAIWPNWLDQGHHRITNLTSINFYVYIHIRFLYRRTVDIAIVCLPIVIKMKIAVTVRLFSSYLIWLRFDELIQIPETVHTVVEYILVWYRFHLLDSFVRYLHTFFWCNAFTLLWKRHSHFSLSFKIK